MGLTAALLGLVVAAGCSDPGQGPGHPGDRTPSYEYEVPLCKTSPWPQMRRTRTNSGRSPVLPSGSGVPWRFRTGKGIFSVPVIGHDSTVLVGSADRVFYAIRPDGSEKWRFPTGEIIDSAAAVAADHTIVFPSGDGNLYALTPEGEEVWRFQAHHQAGQPDEHEGTHCGPFGPQGGPSNWFEGNVIIGENGQLWAGNDNYRMYGLTREGQELFAFFPGPIPFGTVWSAAATLRDGTGIFGSLDFFLYSVSAQGVCNWQTFLGALISASPALSDDRSTVYAGSWDSRLYAVDADTGAVQWSFPTRDHIYGSPAVTQDGRILFGSTDGSFYALSPDGGLLWTYDTLDPIRSSPAVAGDGTIFFGAGDGALYALRPDGTRRWSYDASTQDRNDLNSSPALGLDRLYVGSEDGSVIGFPYSYCEEHLADARCSRKAGGDLPEDGAFLYYVTPGGRSAAEVEGVVQRGSVLTVRLVVRRNGRTLKAGFLPGSLRARLDPPAELRIVDQAGGQFVNLVPGGLLAADTGYALTVSGRIRVEEDGSQSSLSRTFSFRTAPEGVGPPILEVGPESTAALEIRNLAPYQPSLIVSLNQIGFDSVDFLASVIHRSEERLVLWFVAGKPGAAGTSIDPLTESLAPLNGVLDGASFILEGGNLRLITGGPPMEIAEIRLASQFDAGGSFDAGASVFARAGCFGLGEVGLFLLLFGQCNSALDFVAAGTIRGAPYNGAANRRPAGIAVERVEATGGTVTAVMTADDYPLAAHLAAIVLIDEITGRALPIDYRTALAAEADSRGNLARIVLTVPASLPVVPGRTRAIVVTDLYPLASILLE